MLALAANDALDFVGVDDSGKIGVDNLGEWESVVNLFGGWLLVVSVEAVELIDGTLGPDDESANVATWGKKEEVEAGNFEEIDTRDVSEGLGHWGVLLVVDDQWTSSLGVTSVSELALSSSDLAGILNSLNISVSVEGLEELDSLSGLFDVKDGFVADNQWDFWDLFDSVSSGENQSGGGGGRESGDDGVSLLVLVDLSVPSAVGLGWGEHTTTTAHVSESSLAGTVSTATSNTWDTCNSTTSTPRLSRGLVTSSW